MIRAPSRLMKSYRPQRTLLRSVWLLIPMLAGLGYFVYSASRAALGMTAVLVLANCLWTGVENRRHIRQLKAVANSRGAESICDFARAFDRRKIDTWIIRAVHEELQRALTSYPGFPVRASDLLEKDLGLDIEDVEDLIVIVAARANRVLAQTEQNPYHRKIRTVSDLVLFLDAQPSMTPS